MQRELKHILPYIQHGLTCNLMGAINLDTNLAEIFTVTGINKHHVEIDSGLVQLQTSDKDFFPLLRPMSDLFENIVHNGEVICVAKLIADKQPNLCFTSDENGNYIWNDVLDEELDFTSEPQDLPHWITEILNEYHFDWRYDLILKGLAEPIVNDKTKA